jgi:hypothetical protein
VETSDRAAAYTRYATEAAAQYKCGPNDLPARLAAVRRLALEVYTAQLVDGRSPDVSILKWIMEQEQLHAPPPEIPRVDIQLIETIAERCPQCGFERDTGRSKDDPDPQPSEPPPDRPDVGFVQFTQPQLPAPASATAAKPVHLNDLPRRDPGSIHNARLPDGTPARMVGPSYAAYGGGYAMPTVAGPFSVKNEPKPEFEARHNIPLPPGYRGVIW